MTLKDELEKASFTCDEIYKTQQVTVSQRQQKFIPLSALKKICEKCKEIYLMDLNKAISEIEKEKKT